MINFIMERIVAMIQQNNLEIISCKNLDFISQRPLNTPVLFLVFNRINTVIQVFEQIRKAKPPRLYISADGARSDREGEVEKVKNVREYIIQNIDWECCVKTLFRDYNLGCKLAVSSAISWFFENEERGIILEDDCLPSQSFFWFCEELLQKYENDKRIFLISGYNRQNSWKEDKNDYFFSHFGGIWGWASWRRAWDYFDIEIKDIDDFIKENHFENLLGKKNGKKRQSDIYESVIVKKMSVWDYQWAYARHKNSGMACVPSLSLVQNIGFGEDATHTFGSNHDQVSRHEIGFPLKNNDFVVADRKYDELFFANIKLCQRIKNKFIKFFEFFKSYKGYKNK